MRVGFDVGPTDTSFPRGMRRAVGELVAALERRGELEVVRLEGPRAELARAVGEQGLVGLHSFTSGFPLRGPGKRVQTIHELPWRHGVAENADLGHRLWASVGPLFADRVVCATEHVANDLRRRLLPGAAKIRVCPFGVGPPFAEEPPSGVVDEAVLGRYRMGEEAFALVLDGAREKKNLAASLRGLAKLRERGGPELSLVVTGRETPSLRRDLGLATKLGLDRWVTHFESLDEDDLPALYRLASAVPVLSRSEGFGLPVLEALASGTPVLVPREGSQAEVAGPHGIRVDPDDPDSVADGLADALTRREELRYALPERARELSWDAAAERVEALWRELAG